MLKILSLTCKSPYPYISSLYWDGASGDKVLNYYNAVIMGGIASQITSLTIVYSTIYSDADQRKHQSSARHWPLCGEFTGDRWILRPNGQWRGKCFHWMTLSCFVIFCKDMVPVDFSHIHQNPVSINISRYGNSHVKEKTVARPS